MNKTYLGDGVYIETLDNGDLRMTTENGISVQNEIFLDSDTLSSLIDFLKAKEYLDAP